MKAEHLISRQSIRQRIMLLMVLCFLHSYINKGMAQPGNPGVFPITDGALNPRINCMLQTPEGFILAGTQNGLYAFDGARFEKYAVDSGIGMAQVTALGFASGKNIWVGFQNGALGRLQGHRVSAHLFQEGKFNKAVTAIVTDDQGRVWCGTAGEGVYCYDGRKWTNFNLDDGMRDNYVYTLRVQEKQVLAATDGGVHAIRFDQGKKAIEVVTSTHGLADNLTTDLIKPPGYPLLAAHQSGGISWIDITGKSPPGVLPSQVSLPDEIHTLAEVNGMLYAGTSSGLMVARLPESRNNRSLSFAPVDIAPGPVYRSLVDAHGNLWVSSNHYLVRVMHPQQNQEVTLTSAEAAALHACIADRNGNIWYALHNNLFKKSANASPGVATIRYPISGLPDHAEVTSLYEDDFGHLWIGTMGNGLWLFQISSGNIMNVMADSLLARGSILSITGSKNQVWISSLAGAIACHLAPASNASGWPQMRFTNYNNISGLGTNYVYNILVDSRQRVWFATDGQGLTKYENGRFIHFGKADGLGSQVVYSIVEDRKGRLWVNVLDDGLYYFDGQRFVNFTTAHGLSSAEVSFLVATGNGDIAAISEHAIDLINANNLVVQSWEAGQGMGAINTDLHSAVRHPNGGILYCATNGIGRLNPGKPAMAPIPFIEGVELFLNPLDWQQQRDFGAGENNLGIRFNAVEFMHPERLLFQYQLEGFSSGWITTRDKYVNFPQLPPGDYVFRVQASLSPSFQAASEAVYRFSIARPVWQRWWFVTLAALALALGLWALIRYRDRHLHNLQMMRQETLQSQLETLKSQISPHFLFNSLNTVVALIEENPKMAVEYTNQLSDFFRKVVQYRNTDTIPLEEELQLIHTYITIQQKRFGHALQLHSNFGNGLLRSRHIAPLTLQMLVENAIKHNAFTEKQPLEITLEVHDDRLWVSNNVRPKIQPEPGAGMGLQNIQRRYKLLTGKEVEIEQDEHRFLVGIPLI